MEYFVNDCRLTVISLSFFLSSLLCGSWAAVASTLIETHYEHTPCPAGNYTSASPTVTADVRCQSNHQMPTGDNGPKL